MIKIAPIVITGNKRRIRVPCLPPARRGEVPHDQRGEPLASLLRLVEVQARKDSALEQERKSREAVSTEEAFLNITNILNVMEEEVEDSFAKVFKTCNPSSF